MLARNHGSCWKKGSFNAPSCMGRTGTLRVPVQNHNRLLPVCLSTSRNGQHEGISGKELRDVCLGKAGAAVLSTVLLLGSSVGVQPSAAADIDTLQQQQQQVAGNPYTSLAKPLPKQSVDKKRVWTILLGGAVVLFTSTLVVENLEDWFPAIARANKAMALSRKKAEQQERKQSQADVEAAQAVAAQQQQQLQQQQSSAAVEVGLAEARQKVLGESSPATQPSQTSEPAPPSVSYPSVLDSSEVQRPTSSSMASSDSGSSSSSSSSSSSDHGGDGGPGAPPAVPHSKSQAQEGGAQASTASAESAEEGARSESRASAINVSSSTSGSDGKVWLSTEEINAARSMRMQLGEAGASDGEVGAAGARGAGGVDAAAVALQPGAPNGANDSAAAAAAAVAVAVGSNASKTARLEKFVGGVMREGNQAGFLSGMKQGGRAPRS